MRLNYNEYVSASERTAYATLDVVDAADAATRMPFYKTPKGQSSDPDGVLAAWRGGVLDALLMAFPALGLAKIVWAVDVILAMDLPEFRREPANDSPLPQWHDVAPAADVKSGEPLRLDCGDRGLFVYRKGRTLKVYDSRCPHEATNIPHLALQGDRLTCPKHEWSFDLATGRCIAKGDRPLNELPHKVANKRLLVYW